MSLCFLEASKGNDFFYFPLSLTSTSTSLSFPPHFTNKETSNPRLFASLHPPKQRWDARLRSLRDAKEAGLQVSSFFFFFWGGGLDFRFSYPLLPLFPLRCSLSFLAAAPSLPSPLLPLFFLRCSLISSSSFFSPLLLSFLIFSLSLFLFQLGTGVMVGLPGQELDDLAGDLAFFKEIGADMIGIGPYIREPATPVAARWEEEFFGCGSSSSGVGVGGGNSRDAAAAAERTHHHQLENRKRAHMEAMVSLTTRVNALARITLGNVNVAATTALQALHPRGRELALRRGANVLMPILTPTAYRADYSLYEGKPCITDTAAGCEACLAARVGEFEVGEREREREERERKRERRERERRARNLSLSKKKEKKPHLDHLINKNLQTTKKQASVGLTVARGVWGDPPHATRAAEADAVVVEKEGEENERTATVPLPRKSGSRGVVGVGGEGKVGGKPQRRSFSSLSRPPWTPHLSSFSDSSSSSTPSGFGVGAGVVTGEGKVGKGKGGQPLRWSFSSLSRPPSLLPSPLPPGPLPPRQRLTKEDTSALPRTNIGTRCSCCGAIDHSGLPARTSRDVHENAQAQCDETRGKTHLSQTNRKKKSPRQKKKSAFVGKMNSGKSTALCALAPGAAIVDETPGTTADVKVALAEGHGENLGPLKLMDSCVFLEFGFFRRKPKNSLFFLST